VEGGKLQPEFLSQVLASDVGQQQIFAEEDGASREAITFAEIGDFVMPRPPGAEQERIASYADAESNRIYTLIDRIRDGIDRLKEYRTALISAAVTGQIDVRGDVEAERSVKEIDTWARMNLVLELIRRMRASGNKSFGRVMLVKMIYIIQHHVRVKGMRFTYHRKDYGPYDPSFRYGLEKQLQDQGWYRALDQSPDEHGPVEYRPLTRADDETIKGHFENSWADVKNEIDQIVQQFWKMDTTQAEIFATLYAAWNDLLIDKKRPTDDDIFQEVIHNWHPRKRKISKERWHAALQWMRDNDFVPTGFGEPTVKGEM